MTASPRPPSFGASPSREAFLAHARSHSVVPVWCEVLADLETPVSAFCKLVGEGDGFLLESVEHAERWGRFSFIGWNPVTTLEVRGRDVSFTGPDLAGVPVDAGALAAVEAMTTKYRSAPVPGLPPFHGGIVGYLGYDVVREVERLEAVPDDDQEFPDALLSLSASIAAFDHFRQRLFVIENVYVEPDSSDADLHRAYDDAVARLGDGIAALARPLPYTPSVPPADELHELPDLRRGTNLDEYGRAVEAAREHILAGDIFQVVLAQRFDVVDPVDPLALYRVLRLVNPSPYMYFLRFPGQPRVTIVGSSPEALVQLRDGRVIGRPIAGTRKRGRDDEHDRRLAAELVEHPKERAEHVMLVDLARNDIGRVVQFGTERVDELMTLERYSHVMHLTSQVSGDLRDDLGPVDVLRATFPAGTVSGAPKVRAMEIIDDLEPTKRGPYAGVVGYIDFSGNLDVAITIRTMLFRGDEATISAGAGIVVDSVAEDEDLECRNKAAALLTAARAAQVLFPNGGRP